LEREIGCIFVEFVDSSWVVIAGSDFKTMLRQRYSAVPSRAVSISEYPRSAAIQARLLHHMRDKARARALGHHPFEGGLADAITLRVQFVTGIRALSLFHRTQPLFVSPLNSPSNCRTQLVELDRPGQASIIIHGTWSCALDAISSIISNPRVTAVDLLPHFVLHNRNTSLILTNAENAASLVYSDTTWLAASGLDGAGEVIGLADSGVDWDHCAFAPDPPLPLNTANISKTKIIAYFAAGMPRNADFPPACTQRCGSGDISDDLEGHGTHVAGTAGGAALSSSSYFPFNSMAAAARIVVTDIQVSSARLTLPDDLYSGIFADAYNAGARIHSNSWGCGRAPGDSPAKCNVYDSMAADVDRFVWDHEDFVVLVAAGNDGTAGSATVTTPATCKNCIVVGSSEGFYEKGVSYEYQPPASHPGPQASNLAEFSSVGSTLPDRRTKPDVVAPGLNVRSAASNGFISSTGNCGYSKKSGTSMATPAVAALVALTRQYFRYVSSFSA
jgi:hypothetical protein